jgi:hypothetical protein
MSDMSLQPHLFRRNSTRELLRETLQRNRLDRIELALRTFLHRLGVDLRGDERRYRALLYRSLQGRF